RIERAYLRATLDQRVDQRDRRRVAHVVGVGLEREPEHRDALSFEVAAKGIRYALDHARLAVVVDLDRSAHDALIDAELVRRLQKRERVLREAAAAVSRARVQEFRT